jgi:D-arabinose 1-dehydrogenase-like Zn-dependent alcohol dehydrogenase
LIGQAIATKQELADTLELAAAGKLRSVVETRPLSSALEAIKAVRNFDGVSRIVLIP